MSNRTAIQNIVFVPISLADRLGSSSPLAVLAVLLFVGPSFAQTTWHVDDDACPGPGTGTAGDPFCSIQDGIDASANGDTVVVEPGTYVEAIDFSGKAITVRGAGGDPANTTIDGDGALHVVQCIGGEGAGTVLEGMTITGGAATGSSPDDTGGGMFNSESSPTVTNCTFSGNSATFGGAMASILGSSPTVTHCTFSGNSAIYTGGGMFNHHGSPTVTDCTFIGNSGGGMYNVRSSPTVTGCMFGGNSSGTGMYNYDESNPTVTNCTFSGNSPVGMQNAGSGPIVVNCTFSGNEGGMATTGNLTPHLTNCIFWGNVWFEMQNGMFASTIVTFCDVQDESWPPYEGNINADPLFVDADGADNIVGTLDDDLRLSAGSPCIDAGNDTAVPDGVTTDLDGNDRFVDGAGTGSATVDMGAYEYAPTCPGDIDGNGTVDVTDLIAVVLAWSTSDGDADVDGNGIVDVADLVQVVLAWGPCV